MRVLHVDTEMTWRGGENQIRLLLEGLRARGVESHVAVRPASAAAERLRTLSTLVEVPMRGGFDLRAAWRLARYCTAQAIDIVDAHTSNAHSLALLARVFGSPSKLVVHRRVDYQPGRDLANRAKYMSSKVDAYVAISRAIKGVLVDYGVPASKVKVARSAVSGEVYATIDRVAERKALAHAIGLDPNQTFFGNASALTEQKGYDVLMRAMRRLRDRGVACHCFIAGDGHLRDALEQLRIDLRLDHDVTFLGFLEEVPRFLSALDVFTVPSNFEGLGTVILDAVHAGLCVIATEVGGIPEIVRHGTTGLLSPVGDDEALAENMARVAADPELRDRLAAAAREHVRRDFSVDAMVEGNLKVYRELSGK